MTCPGCGASNREGVKFCAECGVAQELSCSQCGNDLRPAAKFCDECGTPVGSVVEASGAGPVGSEIQPTPGVEAEAVRKTVTVLFCDLVGSTAFGEAVDPESAREAMGRYFAMAQSAIESNGGTVAKFIGDGVMAMFGIPEVAEDDADRAVAAGLDLHRFGTVLRCR